jgi:succinyl-CoA synthetase beta subunit
LKKKKQVRSRKENRRERKGGVKMMSTKEDAFKQEVRKRLNL